jgi:hypothetical protein
MHSKGHDLRAGMSVARVRSDPHYFRTIVTKLAQTPLYKTALAVNPFPRSADELQRRRILAPLGPAQEFLWTSAILELFPSELKTFVRLRNTYERAFLVGDLDGASEVVDEVEASVGLSIWLIASRIQLLQQRSGLKAQKDYLESLISAPNLNPYYGYIAFMISYRAEENVSLALLRQDCDDVLATPGVGDHLRYHLLAPDLGKISLPEAPVAREEALPVVDRWQAFVLMSQLQYVRQGDECGPYLLPALQRLQDIGDSRVEALIALISGGLPPGSPVKFDDYTEGNYSRLPRQPVPLELAARASLFDANYAHGYPSESIGATAIDAMKEMLAASEGYVQAQNRVEKAALAGDKCGWAMELWEFLARPYAHSQGSTRTPASRIAALSTTDLNPWNVSTLATLPGRGELYELALKKFPSSSALRLHTCLLSPPMAPCRPDSLPIPEYRSWLYEGHLNARRGNVAAAIELYRKASGSSNNYVATCAKAFLYGAIFAARKPAEALDLVVDHCLSNPGAHRLYPLDIVAKTIREDPSHHPDELALSILMHLAARHIHPKWERDLSDAYENALYAFQVDTPGALIGLEAAKTIPKARLIYFLRYVCIPRVLDDSTSFNSVEEVEAERILMCQALTELDPANSSAYANEIKSVTRDAEVAHLLQQIEASKIYVDEEGLKSHFEETVRPAFERHQVLLKSPSLEYQAEQLAKRLKEMVSDRNVPDLKNLRLPASERESLFDTIFMEILDHFALNPAYGLKIHLSTSIRHGVFEGHIRAPFAEEQLLCAHDAKKNEFAVSPNWRVFAGLNDSELEAVHKLLVRFTQRVESVIKHWLDNLLLIRERGGSTQALFDFSLVGGELKDLRESITAGTTYGEFLDRMFGFCWSKLDQCLQRTRDELNAGLLPPLVTALDSLIASLENSVGHVRVQRLIDAAVRAKTAMHGAVNTVSEWFKRPSDLQRSPFEMELAVRVAIQQVENCYIRRLLAPATSVDVPFKIEGAYLDGMVEVIFLLLQNVIRNSGFLDGSPGVSVSVSVPRAGMDSPPRNGGSLRIQVANSLDSSVDIATRRILIAEAQRRYERDTAMQLAGREGGSGLSKIWRTLQFDLGVEHTLSLEIGDQRRFIATLELSGVRTC